MASSVTTTTGTAIAACSPGEHDILLHESLVDCVGDSPLEPLATPEELDVCSGWAFDWPVEAMVEVMKPPEVCVPALVVLDESEAVAEASLAVAEGVSRPADGGPVSSARDSAISSTLLKPDGTMVFVRTTPSLVKVTVRVRGGWKAMTGPPLKAMMTRRSR
jgi:hypothetical protein